MTLQEKIRMIFYRILKENKDSVLNIRGGRGYSAGHTYPKKLEKPGYGEIENKKQEKEKTGKVKVSKVFKKQRKE